MKIDSVNLLSSLSGNSTIEGGAQSLLGKGAITEEFSNALMAQIDLLSEAKDPTGLPGPLQETVLQTGSKVHDISNSLKQTGGEEELAALLDYLPTSYKKTGATDLRVDVDLDAALLDYLPTSYKKTGATDLNADIDLDAALLNPLPTSYKKTGATDLGADVDLDAALLDPLPTSYKKTGATDLGADVDLDAALLDRLPTSYKKTGATDLRVDIDLDAALLDYLPTSYKKTGTTDLGADVDLDAALLDRLPTSYKKTGATDLRVDIDLDAALLDYLPTSYKKTGATDLGVDVDLDAALLVLTDAPKTVTPARMPDDVASAQNMSAVMALNGLSIAKPLLPEATKLNMTGKEEVVLGETPQKETILRQLLPDKQGVNLSIIENAGSAEKTQAIERQVSLSGIEKEVPDVVATMVQFRSPVDNSTDSPALTKPLSHPDWSKDLGEQIVWMNTKGLSAAEIRLNPAHLGPLSVRIDVNQDQATVMFTAQNAGVKEAIEASIPKLREMLAAQQLNLVNVTISQNSTSDQRRPHYQNFTQTPENNEQGIAGITDKIEHDRVVVNKGLLSIYA